MKLNFAAQAYQARSVQLLAQECVNAFVEPTPKEGKTEMPVYGTPGLSLFARCGPGPINGLHVMAGDLYIVSGAELWRVKASDVVSQGGGAVAPSKIGVMSLSGILSMADNGKQLVMVDSGGAGWIYQPSGLNIVTTDNAAAGLKQISANITGKLAVGDKIVIALDSGAPFNTTVTAAVTATGSAVQFNDALPSQVTAGALISSPTNVLSQILAPAYMPASTVRYFDGYFVFGALNQRQFFISGINDGTQYSGLDFATASAGSTNIIAIEIYHEQLLIFCQDHAEIWWDAGAVSFPFQRYDAAEIARGLASSYCVCSEDNTVFWMGEDGIFYRLNNFAPQRVSTFAMEHAWGQYPQLYLDATCFVIDQEGHKFVVINFPSGKQTWVYDISSQLWHRRESWGTPWV